MNSLPLFHRIAGTKVVLVGSGGMAEAKQRLVERAGGEICSEAEAHHARLAFVALEDGRKAEAAALRLSRSDRPDGGADGGLGAAAEPAPQRRCVVLRRFSSYYRRVG